METAKVWDVAVRLFHWALAALVLGGFLTGEADDAIAWHARVGFAVAGLLVFRVVWGFTGPKQARFRTFVRGPREVSAYLRDYVRGRPPVHTSHNPLGALMVVTLLAVLGGAVVTGALAYGSAEWDGSLAPWIGENAGDALEEAHEVLVHALLFLVPAHVFGVIVSSWLEKQNLVAGMLSGRKHVTDDAELERASWLRMVAAVALGIVVIWVAVQIFAPRVAKAEPLDRQSAEALYRAECGTCHIVYPPGLLPAASWRRMLAGADAHFGETLELSNEDRDRVESWLATMAADVKGGGVSAKIVRSVKGQAPLRISEVPYVRRQHEDIEEAVFRRKSIGSRANCGACHSNAERASFRKNRIPKS